MATESRNRQRPLRTLIIFFAFMAALFAIMALSGAWAPKLGLDLRGGTTITLTARNVTGAGAVDAASLEQARTIIQQRVDSIGVGESEVATVGNNQVQVSVPNVAPAQLQEMVGQTAQLFFRPVHSEEAVQAAVQPTDPATTAAPGDGTAPADTAAPADTTAPADGTPTDETSPAVNRRPAPGLPTPAATPRPTEPAAVQPTTEEALAWTPTSQDLADYAAFTCGDEFPDVTDQPLITCDREGTAKYLLGPVLLSGDMLSNAQAGIPQGQVSWVVNLQFNDVGTGIFSTVSTDLVAKTPPQNQFAVVLDSQVITAPRMNQAIPNGQAQISGDFNQQSATDLANVLRYGALPLAFDLSEVSNVSPTLGGEQLSAGLVAGAIGLILVLGYAVLYYRALSVVVIGSLAVAAVLTYQFMVLLGEGMGFALNLPGIAGVIVAIGMTADSFIIFFERIRDEVREGRSLRSAIETGWLGSRKTILIADAVSLLSAVVLFILAIGSVKGFAFTLGLTTLIDIAVVFWFTKPLVTLLGRTRYFGEGRRFSGFEPDHLGATGRSPLRRRVAATPKEA
ncbi:MAG: protein translocase subunit SecD [Propionibacteriaceae bacterium]|nr:protein translocase subunit SecD [Propionibacteriaceae bacterium]